MCWWICRPASRKVAHLTAWFNESSRTSPQQLGGTWSTTENKGENFQVSLLSTLSRFFFSLFPQFWSERRTDVGQREDMCPGSRGGYEWVDGVGSSRAVRLVFTRCCCCFRGLYTECLHRCSLCRGAERHTCPRTSRCLSCVHEMVYTESQKTRL